LKLVFLAVAGLLGAKVLWNFLVPYAALVAQLRGKPKTTSVSIFVELDLILVLLLVTVSVFLPTSVWPHRVVLVAAYGVGAVVLSLVHMVIVSALLRWATRRLSGHG
jgi:hypothetical protein